MNLPKREKREARLCHALFTVGTMAVMMFLSIVVFEVSPHTPLVFGTLAAGLTALWLGYSWDEILDGMISGITDSLEAILILMLIGMLVGSWIAAGTVPAMIWYGLKLVSPGLFLPSAMLICLMVAFAIGSWGTVGTIGLAFMGMAIALQIPAPLAAGAVISGAYLGEVISPLSDATNLAAAVTGADVFKIVKKTALPALLSGMAALAVYAFLGFRFSGAGGSVLADSLTPLMDSLADRFRISPFALLPMLLVLVCILVKLPAIPSMLFGTIAGMIQAMWMQKAAPEKILTYLYSGFVSESGNELLDNLLTAGGMEGMMESISIILIAMAFGGVMKRTRQMDALVKPLVDRVHSVPALKGLTVLTCIFTNAVLPDQYLGISMPGQMYEKPCRLHGLSTESFAATLLGGGAVTSPLIPWNTCGIYCMTILGVSAVQYAPFAFLGMLLPVVTIILTKRNGRSEK